MVRVHWKRHLGNREVWEITGIEMPCNVLLEERLSSLDSGIPYLTTGQQAEQEKQ